MPYYLNYNIQRVEDILLNQGTIQEIATKRASDGEIGDSSIGGLVNVRLWKDYSISIEYGQSGSDDNYKDTDRLELSFTRVSIWDNLDGISGPDDEGNYWDEHNKEKMTWDDLVDLVVTNGSPSLYELTRSEIEEFISDLKEQPEKCSHCGSTNIRKHGLETHSDGDHQRFQCKDCLHYSTSEWVL